MEFIVTAAATARPETLGPPVTHWSLRKLAACLAGNRARPVRIGRERLRQILHAAGSSPLPADPDLEGIRRPG